MPVTYIFNIDGLGGNQTAPDCGIISPCCVEAELSMVCFPETVKSDLFPDDLISE